MKPNTTSGMITGIVNYLGTRLVKNESVHNFFNEFTDATVDWIKPLFLREDGTENDAVKNLKKKPESNARKNAVKSLLEIELEDNPDAKKHIVTMYEAINKKDRESKSINNITNSKNVNTGNVNTGGGDFHLGDKHINKTNIKGDNNISIQGIQDSEINLY